MNKTVRMIIVLYAAITVLLSGCSIEDFYSDPVSSQHASGVAGSASSLSELKVHYIDVGQGDSTLLQGPDFHILIDAGRHDRNDVVPYLNTVGIDELDLVVGTHPHADHIGQLDRVLQEFSVQEVWMSGDSTTSATFERVLDAIMESGASYYEPRRGEQFQIGSADIQVISPEQIGGDLNDGSIAMKVTYGNVSFLFTGDAEAKAEREMVESDLALEADIYQAGHHGSSTSNTEDFLAKVRPEVMIYSAGEGNSYGHPHDEVVERFAQMGVEVYGTDVHGTVVITTNGETYEIETMK